MCGFYWETTLKGLDLHTGIFAHLHINVLFCTESNNLK